MNEQSQTAASCLRRRSRRLRWEVVIVFSLSLGKSAIYAVIALIDAYTRGPIGDQTAALNTSQNSRELFDLTYQLLSVAFALVPVALALYLLSESGHNSRSRLGLDGSRPVRDGLWGLGLGAAIGIPGLGLYVVGRALGQTLEISAASVPAHWWTVPVLLLAALKNGLLEEILVVGYLRERLHELGWRTGAIIAISALLRASYHLYQGWGPFFGNLAMGLIFAGFYLSRWGRRRIWPLIVAHTVIDVVAFIGYQYLPDSWLAALGVAG